MHCAFNHLGISAAANLEPPIRHNAFGICVKGEWTQKEDVVQRYMEMCCCTGHLKIPCAGEDDTALHYMISNQGMQQACTG